MAEWLYEAGIGEDRAALVEHGVIAEAFIEPHDLMHTVGSIVDGRLLEVMIPGRRGLVRLGDGTEMFVEPLSSYWCLGGPVRVEIVREAIAERGVVKRAKGRPSAASTLLDGPRLRDRLATTGVAIRDLRPILADDLEAAGWGDIIERAQSGIWSFPGGTLRIEPTAAMTVIDVDGHLPPEPLARAAATASGAAIRCLDVAGSIVIDFPTLAGKAERQRVADAFDSAFPHICERTAINGFGLMQIVRPRIRPSLIEHLTGDAAGHAARALLRLAQRSGVIGATRLVAPPAVTAVLSARPEWTDKLARELGGSVALRTDASLAMSGAYVERA